MNNIKERRSHTRYPASSIQVMVKSIRDEDAQWIAAQIGAVDFNRYGISLETSYNFFIGDILAMVIRTDDSTVAEVYGLVCNRRNLDHGYRFGIRFEHQGAEQEASDDAIINISQEILMIERAAAGVMH